MYEVYEVGDRVEIVNSRERVFGERVGDTGVVIATSPNWERSACILFDSPMGGWHVYGKKSRYAQAIEMGLFCEGEVLKDCGAWIPKDMLKKTCRYNSRKIEWLK